MSHTTTTAAAPPPQPRGAREKKLQFSCDTKHLSTIFIVIFWPKIVFWPSEKCFKLIFRNFLDQVSFQKRLHRRSSAFESKKNEICRQKWGFWAEIWSSQRNSQIEPSSILAKIESMFDQRHSRRCFPTSGLFYWLYEPLHSQRWLGTSKLAMH